MKDSLLPVGATARSTNAPPCALRYRDTAVRYGMEDYAKKGVNSTSYDIGGNNDVRLPYNK